LPLQFGRGVAEKGWKPRVWFARRKGCAMKTTTAHLVIVAGLLGASLLGLAFTSHDAGSFEKLFADPGVLCVWIALLTLAALAPLPLPSGRGTVLLSPAFEFGAILVFGTAPACWMSVFSRLITNTQCRWAPLPRCLFRLAQGVLAVGAAGLLYRTLGGFVGAGLFQNHTQGMAVLVSGGTYVAITVGTRALAPMGTIWRVERSEVWVPRILRAVFYAFLGTIISLATAGLGASGAGLFLFALIAVAYSSHLRSCAETAHLGSVRSLMATVDAADPFTRGHSYRISKMCVKVARHLGFPEPQVRELEYAAVLHDIGRNAIQRELWGKSGTLSREEQIAVRHHPRIGADWIRRSGFFAAAAEIVEAHHEQPDGKGYPRGLHRGEIPPGSRIIMVVAAFDAMTSDRPYRKGLSPEEAFEELLTHSGTQFFSEIVEALIELYSKGLLFDEFEDQELERYREGAWNSRAVERFLSQNSPVPLKRGAATNGDDEHGVPTIDFPFPVSGEEGKKRMKQYELDGDGLRLEVASASNVGCVRSNNEDSFGVFEGGTEGGVLLVLADGMGGAAAGEVASRLAVDTVHGRFFDELKSGSPAVALRKSMDAANAVIYSQAAGNADLKGMGTTCTAASVIGDTLHIGHVGDSRAYLVTDDDIRILTRDHTLAAELAGMGGRDGAPEGARNVLTRCLGNQAAVQVEVFDQPIALRPGNVLVLCSDGLSNLVAPDEIFHEVTETDPEQACLRLVDLARDRGGPDNITVQVARMKAA
jgi:putative nucleotidyltransferase with HDIG domain